jgi:hypothetical protein
MPTAADRLRALLKRPGLLVMPGCHDAMSARLIEEAGFELGFMSGFAVSAVRLGMPDTGLISYGELVDQGTKHLPSGVDSPHRRRRYGLSAARRTSSARVQGYADGWLRVHHARRISGAEAMRPCRRQDRWSIATRR